MTEQLARIVKWELRHGRERGAVNDGWITVDTRCGGPGSMVAEIRIFYGESHGDALARFDRIMASATSKIPFTDAGAAALSVMLRDDVTEQD